jgi:hypothetical protein
MHNGTFARGCCFFIHIFSPSWLFELVHPEKDCPAAKELGELGVLGGLNINEINTARGLPQAGPIVTVAAFHLCFGHYMQAVRLI